METGAVDQQPGADVSPGGLHPQVRSDLDRRDLRPRFHLGAPFLQATGQRGGDRREIDRSGPGHVQTLDALRVGLYVADSRPVQTPQVGDSVGDPPPMDLLQGRYLGGVDGHEDLPVGPVLESLLGAEGAEKSDPRHAESRLQRAGPVIDPGVDHPTVVAGLVNAHSRFLFQKDDADAGGRLGQAQPRCEPEDPPSDDCDVVALVHPVMVDRARGGPGAARRSRSDPARGSQRTDGADGTAPVSRVAGSVPASG